MAGNSQEYRTSLLEWQKFLLAESHALKAYPALLFQQAVNRPDAEAPARLADVVSDRSDRLAGRFRLPLP